MKTRNFLNRTAWLLAIVLTWPAAVLAQVPVDEDGNVISQSEPGTVVAGEDLPILTDAELEEIVGPVALYPDDLLAIVLPASTYPLQIVQAARFLEELEGDASLKPDEDWDDSVVALTNYPEVVEMMSEDLDWTWRLGEAVVAQQTDVIKAIEAFRDRAYAAGNLKSDDFQTVAEDDGIISITPVEEDVIYVPYYEPERVVVYQPRPVYYYYPRAYPVYYYPYPAGYSFSLGYFWGVTTAFSIGWHSHHVHVWHHSYHGHPYYGHHYWNDWWYRRPDIHVHHNYYSRSHYNRHYDRYRRGDYWAPHTRRTVRSTDQRITRTRYYPSSGNPDSVASSRDFSANERLVRGSDTVRPATTTSREKRAPITFRERTGTASTRRNSDSARPSTVKPSSVKPATERPAPRRPSTVRPSTTRSQQLARLENSDRTRQDAVRPSRPKASYSRPSTPKASYSRPSTPKASYSRPSTPKASYSRPSTPKPSYTRPSTPKASYSRPSTPKPSYSRPSTPKASQSRPSSSGNKSSNTRPKSSSRNSSERKLH
jgi:hypothetical protein